MTVLLLWVHPRRSTPTAFSVKDLRPSSFLWRRPTKTSLWVQHKLPGDKQKSPEVMLLFLKLCRQNLINGKIWDAFKIWFTITSSPVRVCLWVIWKPRRELSQCPDRRCSSACRRSEHTCTRMHTCTHTYECMRAWYQKLTNSHVKSSNFSLMFWEFWWLWLKADDTFLSENSRRLSLSCLSLPVSTEMITGFQVIEEDAVYFISVSFIWLIFSRT